jgi:hypothetical protein
MQLNIHVPEEREGVLRALDEVSGRTHRPKSELVLDAPEEYLRRWRPQLPSLHLGQVAFPPRDDVYLHREEG